MGGHQLEAERLRLRRDKLVPHAVKSDAAGRALVNVGKHPYVDPLAERAVQGQGSVFAAAAHQGVRHGTILRPGASHGKRRWRGYKLVRQ